MGKVKSELLTEFPCVICRLRCTHSMRDALRWATRPACNAERLLAKKVAAKHHTILPLHKQGYMAFTGSRRT
jgi:hypothetical protein